MSKPVYYVCSDSVFNRLKEETRCLFERYPEDDGVMVFDPGERVRRDLPRILESCRYWAGITECRCDSTHPIGGCLKCDMDEAVAVLGSLLTESPK